VLGGIGWWNEPDWLTAQTLARYYFRDYREYDVWVMACPPGLPTDVGAAEMAAGYADVLADIGPARVLCTSLGGAVGAHLAAETELVERLVLVSCGAGLGSDGRQTLARWRDHAAARRYRALHTDYIRTVYAGARRLVVPPLYRAGVRLLPEPAAPGDVERSCVHARVRREYPVGRVGSVTGRRWETGPARSRRQPPGGRRLDGPTALVPGGHGVYEEAARRLPRSFVRFSTVRRSSPGRSHPGSLPVEFVARALDCSPDLLCRQLPVCDQFDGVGLVVGRDTVDRVERVEFVLDVLFTAVTRHTGNRNCV
jgi:hypothetical protein